MHKATESLQYSGEITTPPNTLVQIPPVPQLPNGQRERTFLRSLQVRQSDTNRPNQAQNSGRRSGTTLSHSPPVKFNFVPKLRFAHRKRKKTGHYRSDHRFPPHSYATLSDDAKCNQMTKVPSVENTSTFPRKLCARSPIRRRSEFNCQWQM